MTPPTIQEDGGPPFRESELLRWRGFDDYQKQWNVREVTYREIDERDPTFALVEWGLRGDGEREVFRVPLSELARPLPRPVDSRFAPPPIPPPPKPPRSISVPDIPPLRSALRQALDRRAEQQQKLDAAQLLAAKAESELAASRSNLAALVLKAQDHAHALEAAMRSGAPLNGEDHDTALIAKVKAERDVQSCEAVTEKFHSELREARGALADANSAIYTAAQKVTMAIFAAEAQRLVTDITDAKLGIWAEAAVRFVDEHRQRADGSAPFKALRGRLIAGDVDAELE